MTDRELLEAAAKAANIPIDAWYESANAFHLPHGTVAAWWNPLSDDGDALRLAMQCNMRVSQREAWVDTHAVHLICVVGDTMSATRRAIVCAAAAMAAA